MKQLYVMQPCGRCKVTVRKKWLTKLETVKYAVLNEIESYLCGLCKKEILARHQPNTSRAVKEMHTYLSLE